METATKHSKASVLALAKRKWKNAAVEYKPRAETAAQRAEANLRREGLIQRRDELNDALKGMSDTYKPLMDAAQFVCDVDAQEPSLSQLREAFANRKRHDEMLEEYREVRDAVRNCGGHSYRYRVYTLMRIGGLGTGATIQAEADSWDELAEKIEAML